MRRRLSQGDPTRRHTSGEFRVCFFRCRFISRQDANSNGIQIKTSSHKHYTTLHGDIKLQLLCECPAGRRCEPTRRRCGGVSVSFRRGSLVQCERIDCSCSCDAGGGCWDCIFRRTCAGGANEIRIEDCGSFNILLYAALKGVARACSTTPFRGLGQTTLSIV